MLSQNVFMTVGLFPYCIVESLDIWVTKEDNYYYYYDKDFNAAHAGQYKPIEKDHTIRAKIVKLSLHINNSQ